MKKSASGDLAPMGGNGGVVEAGQRHFHHKTKVLSLVDRTTGQARSKVVDKLSAKEIGPILAATR